MIEMRFHGRGGQGAVKGCQILCKALVQGGKHAQFIPAFGVERKGSPVYGYFRLDDKNIRYNCQVYHPDIVVIFDDSLMESINVFEGIHDDAKVIVNTRRAPSAIKAPAGVSVAALDATDIATQTIGAAIPNTVMLGAIARVLDTVDKDILRAQVLKAFGEKNVAAFDEGYAKVRF